jgi:CheY-like chemotaxis protein
VVNDNARGLEILTGYLRHAGMDTLAAASGPEALEILEHERFDLALVDDQMPDMDGPLLCELIRIDQTWQHMRVVLLCAADIRGAHESGAVDRSIIRPVMPEQLIQTLAAVLEPEQADAVGCPGSDAAVAAAAASNDSAAAPAPLAPGRQGSTPVSGVSQVRVLLAEDNVVNQKVAVRMLEKIGCFIDVADNGAEALEMWRHFNYDVIFMDCQMPELDGLEATRHIRREELRRNLARTPIIAMTANAMHQDRSDCLAAGMDDYLSKPVNQGDLPEVLSRWVAVDSVRKAVDSGGENSLPQ